MIRKRNEGCLMKRVIMQSLEMKKIVKNLDLLIQIQTTFLLLKSLIWSRRCSMEARPRNKLTPLLLRKKTESLRRSKTSSTKESHS
jgi:hypothetical protein